MKTAKKSTHLATSIGLLCLLLAQPGCYLLYPSPCADIPPGQIAAPPGAALSEWQTAQAMRAEFDDFVIYEADWIAGSADLGPHGKRRLVAIAERVACGENPIIINKSEDNALNEERRYAVVNQLGGLGFAGCEESVQVGYAQALPLPGREAPRAVQDMVTPTPLPSSDRNDANGGIFGSGRSPSPFGGFGLGGFGLGN